jgi:hypothetical protein
MEEPRAARGTEWQVPQLVEDHEFKRVHAFYDLPGFALNLLLLKGVDQLNGQETAVLSAVMLVGLNAQGPCYMGLSFTRAADH